MIRYKIVLKLKILKLTIIITHSIILQLRILKSIVIINHNKLTIIIKT